MIKNLLEGLNEAQRAAVTSTAPLILCLAGAGTGKTKTLTHRIARLCQDGVEPENMLALTFTRLAGMEMKERLVKLIGDVGKLVFMNTFHAFAVQVLRQHGNRIGIDHNFTIYDQADREAILEQIINEFGDETTLKVVKQAFEIEHKLIPTGAEEIIKVLREYDWRLRQNNAVDLDRLIVTVNKLWNDNPDILEEYRQRYQFVFVDEYQDTSDDQMLMLELLKPVNLFVVGDDRQAIYGWRGAKVQYIMQLSLRPDCTVIPLVENYRSTRQIIRAANNVISKNNMQTKTELRAQRDGREVTIFEYANPESEAKGIVSLVKQMKALGVAPGEIAVLARTNAQVEYIKAQFDRDMGLTAQVISKASDDIFKHQDIRSLMAWLSVLSNPHDDYNLKKALVFPVSFISPMIMSQIELNALDAGTSLMDALEQYPAPIEGIKEFFRIYEAIKSDKNLHGPANYFVSLIYNLEIEQSYQTKGLSNRWDDVQRALSEIQRWQSAKQSIGENYSLRNFLWWLRYREFEDRTVKTNPEAVNLMTVHASKGLEFSRVIMAGMNQGRFPLRIDKDMEETRRLCYVAGTRAKEELFITYANQVPDWNGRLLPAEPSQFIKEMEVA